MILVLTDGEQRVWIDVEIRSGCEVRVGSVTLDCSNVEPTPWYKVSLLDYLSVDVRKSMLTWVIDSPLRSRTTSPAASLAKTAVGSHDSGCCGDDDVISNMDGVPLETIAETSSSSPSQQSPWETHTTVGGHCHGNVHDSMDHRLSNTLPRQGAVASASAASAASASVAAGKRPQGYAGAGNSAAVARSNSAASGLRRAQMDVLRDDKHQADFHSRFSTDKLTSSLSQCSSAQSTFSSHTSIASNLSTGSNTSAAAPAHVVSAATASDNTVTSGTADVATGIAIPAKQGSSRSGGDAAAAAGDGDSSSSESDVMGGLLAHEHILTLNDLLANVENSLEYDSSVVYEMFHLCEQLLKEVVSKDTPEHTRWIEERYGYGRLISKIHHIETLIQILHSHLLPYVTFAASDRSMLEWALGQQQDAIKSLSEEILAQSRQEGMLATSVDNLLARVLPGVEASLRDGLFSRLFLSHLVNDIDERGLLRRASEQLDSFQYTINSLKKKQDATGSDTTTASTAYQEKLQTLRGERDAVHEKLIDLLKTREMITLQLQSAKPDKGNLLPAQKSYLQACKVHQEQHIRTATLMEKKVAALGMREAMQETLQSLDNTVSAEDDMPTSMIVGSVSRSTLLTASLAHVTQELLPLRDAVDVLISHTDNPIGVQHSKFCTDIVLTCCDITVPNILAFGVPRVGAVVLSDIIDGRSSGPKRLADLGRCTSVYEVIDPAREYVEDISGKVMRHMDSVVSQLMGHFPQRSEQMHRKVYLTYERSLYQKIGHTIDDLYTVWVQKIINQLLRVTEFVESVSFDRLCKHMRLPEGWWMALFEEVDEEDREQVRRTALFSPKAPAAPFQSMLAPAAAALHRLIGTFWPLSKAELLTKSIQHITRSLGEYHGRHLSGKGVATQVGSDDLVPVVILFILYCKPEIIAALCMNCLLLEDMCAEFLRNGMHGFSMVQFQGALHVIASVLPTEQLNPANSSGTGPSS